MILPICPSESMSSSDGVRDEPRGDSAVFKLKQTTEKVEHAGRSNDNIMALTRILDDSRIYPAFEGLETYLNEKNMGCMCILLMAITAGRMLIMLNTLLSHMFETWCSPTKSRNWFDSTCLLARTRSSVVRDESRMRNQTVTRTLGITTNQLNELIPTQGRVGHVIATRPCTLPCGCEIKTYSGLALHCNE